MTSEGRDCHRATVDPRTVYVWRCPDGCGTKEYATEEAALDAARTHEAAWSRTMPVDTRRCLCWPDYSTPDAPSLDDNPDCPAHAAQFAETLTAQHMRRSSQSEHALPRSTPGPGEPSPATESTSTSEGADHAHSR